jgi:hypothetical protein
MRKAMVPKHLLRIFIVKTVGNRDGRVLYAASGGGGTEEKDKAQRFFSREQALDVASQIAIAVRERAVASIEEVQS